MLDSQKSFNKKYIRKGSEFPTGSKKERYRELASRGRISSGLIDELYNPIDSINRFINLALHVMGEGSQGRQFLLESKSGIRKASVLLKKLNNHTKKMEKELRELYQETRHER